MKNSVVYKIPLQWPRVVHQIRKGINTRVKIVNDVDVWTLVDVLNKRLTREDSAYRVDTVGRVGRYSDVYLITVRNADLRDLCGI